MLHKLYESSNMNIGTMRHAAAALVAFSITTSVVGLNAYFQVFSFFAEYDDEGYVLISLKMFRQGLPLYDVVYSQYGPFYYGFLDVLFSVLPLEVSHDGGRLITVGIWATTSLLCGLVLFGLTRSLWIGCTVQLLSALALDTLRNESMHPGGLVCLLLACTAATTLLMPSRPRLAWIALGALGAALAMTKINVGIFALLAIGLVAVGALRTASTRRVLLAIAGLVVVSAPSLLMASHYHLQSSVPSFMIHVTAALLPLVVIELISPPAILRRSNAVAWTAAGAIGTILALSAFAMVHGTTLRPLINVLFIAPLRHPDVLFRPLELAPHSRKFALVAAAAGVAVALWKRRSPGVAGAVALEACLRIGVGLTMWMAVPGILPARLGFYFAPLAWVAALAPTGIPDPPALSFARRFLPLLAVLQTLHAYPVSRSQVQWGAFLLVPVAAIAIFDGARQVGELIVSQGVRARRSVVANAGGVLLLLLVAVPVARTLTSSRRAYTLNEPLGLHGSQRVRLPPAQVRQLRHVAGLVRDYGCLTFFGAPGMGSFYFWTQTEPPTAMIATRWGYLFDRAMQERVIRDIEKVDGLCVIERGGAIAHWAQESAVHPSPLCQYLLSNFVPASGDSKYQLLVPKRLETAVTPTGSPRCCCPGRSEAADRRPC